MTYRDALLGEIRTKLASAKLPYSVTDELPWNSANEALYIKNLKKIYVDAPYSNEDTAFSVLNGRSSFVNETTTITAYIMLDAKTNPPMVDSLINILKLAKDTPDIVGVTNRQCDVNDSLTADKRLITITYRFTKLIIN